MPADAIPRRYAFKLYPTREQSDELWRQARMVGDLWNALLQRQEDNYRRWQGGWRGDARDWPEKGADRARRLWREGRAVKAHLSEYDLGQELTVLYAECPEWRALSTWTGRRVARALDDAFKAFFRRAKQGAGAQSGYPRYRPRRMMEWIPHRSASGFRMTPIRREGAARQLDWWVRLKGIPGEVRAMGRLPRDVEVVGWGDADVRWRDGAWWLSVQVEIRRERAPGRRPVVVEIDGVDCFARVNGRDVPAWAIGLDASDLEAAIERLQHDVCTELGVAHDTPPPKRRWPDEYRMRLRRLHARAARRRREALHVWTTRIVRDASRLVLVRPRTITDHVASGHGDERNWGAATETKAAFNRAVLGQAPGLAIQMLTYKAAEAGIEVEERAADAKLATGNEIVTAAKHVRTARAAVRKRRKEMAA